MFLQAMKELLWVSICPLVSKCNKETLTHHTGCNHVENNSSWPLMQGLRNVRKLRSCNRKNVSILPDKVLQALLAAQTLNPAWPFIGMVINHSVKVRLMQGDLSQNSPHVEDPVGLNILFWDWIRIRFVLRVGNPSHSLGISTARCQKLLCSESPLPILCHVSVSETSLNFKTIQLSHLGSGDLTLTVSTSF